MSIVATVAHLSYCWALVSFGADQRLQQYWSAIRINIKVLQSNNKRGWNVTGFLDQGIVESWSFITSIKSHIFCYKTREIMKKKAWRDHKTLLCNAQATGYVVIEVVHITRWSILHGSPLLGFPLTRPELGLALESLHLRRCLRDDIDKFSRLEWTPTSAGHTDGQTQGHSAVQPANQLKQDLLGNGRETGVCGPSTTSSLVQIFLLTWQWVKF